MKYFLFALGCKVNSYENSALGEELNSLGHEKTSNPEEADLIVINTCSVTSTADQKSRQHIRKFKRACPKGIVAVMGCYSEKNGQECIESGADIVVGTIGRKKIISHIDEFIKDRKPILDVMKAGRNASYEEFGTVAYSDATRAYLKVQDGCDNFCSYCLIPSLRGNSRSRERSEILFEAKKLVEKGYKEIIITGIHIGRYGYDLYPSYNLSNLLKDIMDLCPGLYRLRVSSLDEVEIDDAFLSLLENYPQLVSHLHIPLQSGSSKVLKSMGRRYDTEAFLNKIERIRKARPDIAITTDVIVGYPGESEEDFLESYSFCEKARFAEIHVFPFSARKGTLAAKMKDTSPEIKKDRVKRLLSLSKKMREEYESSFYGKELEVLFEDFNPEKKIARGHTSNYLLVKKESDVSLHNQIINVLYSPDSKAD